MYNYFLVHNEVKKTVVSMFSHVYLNLHIIIFTVK